MLRLCASLLTVSMITLAAAEEPRPDIEMKAEGDVTIAPDGTVTDYQSRSSLAPEVAQFVDRRVRQWHFRPILVDGKPVAAKSAVRIHLKGVPSNGDNYRIEVANVHFGEPRRPAKFQAPKYPPMAKSSRVSARVLMCVKMDASGTVTSAEPIRTSLDFHSENENQSEFFRELFEGASAEAVRSWHFDMSESIDGKTVGGVAIVPFSFHIRGRGGADGEWKAFEPGPTRELTPECGKAAASHDRLDDLSEGQAQSLTSRFELHDADLGNTQ